MLYVVNRESNEILFRVDAWQRDCMERAQEFIYQSDLTFEKQEITLMGDMVLWVA